MKCLLFLALCFVYAQCRPDLPPAESMKEHWNKAMEKALKRRYGESYAASADDECSKACQKPPPPGFGQHLMHFRDPKLEDIAHIYDKDLLTKVCQYANETSQCVKACPDTQRRAYLREVFAPVKYLCVDSHIVQNADCYKTALAEAGPACMTGECAPKKAALTESYTAYKAAEPKTKALAETFVGNLCDMFRCGVFCGDTVRTAKCGADANKEIHDFYKQVAKSFEAVRFLSPRDYVIDVPQQCKIAA
jgi:hypothetical protein